MSNCSIGANADVSGIGIRINLDTTILLMALIPDIPERTSPLLEVLAENAGISGLALLVTAIYQTRQGSLSLYHAIFIIHILYFTGILVAPSGHYKHDAHKKRAIVSGLITYGCYLMFTAYALYVLGKGTSFSGASSLTCTDPSIDQIMQVDANVEYILFFKPFFVSATWLRVLWMASLGVSLALLIFVPVFGCIRAFRQGVIAHGQPSRPQSSLFFRVMWVGKVLGAVYGVATLELFEKANLRNGVLQGPEDDWSFGQVFALVQLMTTLNEAVHCLISAPTRPAAVNQDEKPVEAPIRRRDSSASSRTAANAVQPGNGPLTGESESAPNERETNSNLDTEGSTSTAQPRFHGQTHGAMMIV